MIYFLRKENKEAECSKWECFAGFGHWLNACILFVAYRVQSKDRYLVQCT